MYPVTTFVHVDNALEVTSDSIRNYHFQESAPNANSTMIEPRQQTQDHSSSRPTSNPVDNSARTYNNSIPSFNGEDQAEDRYSNNVGHISHIPRTPPSPATYTIPSIINKSVRIEKNQEDIFGMIKLGNDDICYTSGTIEWVGRKRSFPINSGFKIIRKNQRDTNEPLTKKTKRLNNTFMNGISKIKDCDCADVLPTVNAIVDHLNALHEAVDLVDLRLNTLEDVVTNSE